MHCTPQGHDSRVDVHPTGRFVLRTRQRQFRNWHGRWSVLASWLVSTMDQEGSADSFLRDVSSENIEGKAVEEHSEKQYPGCRRNRICRSMWLWLSFFSMGLANSQRGPAFLDIQMITGTTLQQAASFFTASFVGSVVGSLLGGVVYDVISQTLFLGVSLLAHAVLTMLTPFCRLYVLMAAVSFLVAVFGGGVSTAVNADVLRVWEGRGGVAMQGLHFSYALGGVIAPLITQPFLAPRDDLSIFDNTSFALARPFLSFPSEDGLDVIMLDWKNATGQESRGSVTEPESTEAEGKTESRSYSLQQGLVQSFYDKPANSTSEQTQKVYGTQVHFAYMISAVTTTLSALPFLWMYLGRTKRRRRGKDSQGFCLCTDDVDGKAERKITRDAGGLPVGLAHVTLAWTCVFFVLYYAVERSFVSFLPMFVVQHLRWTKADASLLTSVFWTSLAVARFLSIFLVRAVSTVAILTFCCAVFVASLVGMLLVSMVTAHAHWSVWTCIVLSGAASAGIVPTTLSWVEDELLCVTGRTLAVIAVTSSLGSIANPLLLGFLIEHYGALWFWYILLGEATASAFALLLLLLFSQLYLRPRFGSRRQRKLLAASLVVVKVEDSGRENGHIREDSGNCAS